MMILLTKSIYRIMKKYNLILSLFATLMFASCFEDETTMANMSSLSEITIQEGSINSVYNINKNDTLVITPIFTQSKAEKQLRHTWEIDLVEYSHEKEFHFVGEKLGVYNCRYIVENEDGKTFFPFKLYVNSPYEEGITVLSASAEGRPMLSFMQTPADKNEWGEFTTKELLTLNNQDFYFSSNPTDIVQSGNVLFLMCQGGTGNDDLPAIYYLNEKTFVIESMLNISGYDDFKPTRLLIPSTWGAYVTYPVLCENGKVYSFSPYEASVGPSTNLGYIYSQATHVDDGDYYYDILLWDKEANGLALIYGGYGPFYFGDKYHLSRLEPDFATLNYFANREFITMVPVRMTADEIKLNGYEVLVLTKSGIINSSVVVGTSFWGSNNDGSYKLYNNGGFSTIAFGNLAIDENTPVIASKKYQLMLFAEGNKVRKWNYTTSQQITAASTHTTVGSDNAIITGFEMSEDQQRTYIAFYEPTQSGLNGSVWVIDTDKGTVLNKYENICYQPVKIMYKKK